MKNKYALLWVFFVLAACGSHINSSYKPLGGSKSFDKEGHRGCRGLMPENTIPAFLKAVDLGVNTLEMDAHITKDTQVVISHDPYFNPDITTKPDGTFVTTAEEKNLVLYNMPYADIQQYDVGLKPYPRFPRQQKIHAVKPLLRDVIGSVEAYAAKTHKRPLQYNIETKCTPQTDGVYHPAPGPFVEMIMAVVLQKKIEDRVIIQSFDVRSLQYVHEKYPAMKTALLVDITDKKSFALQLKSLGFIPTIYSPEYHLVTPLLVKQCHDTGIRLLPWTVDDKPTIQQLQKLGVDGIITDYPDLF